MAFVYTASPARAGNTASRWLLLLVLLLLRLSPAWAQVPAFTTSRSTGNAYTSIGATGSSFTFSSINTDDATSAAITLPSGFAFTYQGTAVTGFVACTNGWLSLNPNVTDNSWNNNLGGNANSAPIPQLLAPFWDDLVCQGNNSTTATLTASMKYLITGTAPNRVLTVEWLGMEIYQNAGPNLNFQVKLFETTNVIQYQYGVMSGFSGAQDYNYTYSLGLNGTAPATTYLAQQVSNSNFFAQANGTTASTGANALNIVPESYSQLQFVPAAALATGTAPTTTVPANNEPAGAFTLPLIYYSPTSFATAYTSANATASAGIAACTATTPGTADDDVWFKFTLTSTQNTSITLRSSGGYDAVLQVFSNAGTTALACVNASGLGLTENYNNPALPAGTYYVRVYHAGAGSGTTGQFALAAYVIPVTPANDECTAAVALTSAGTCTTIDGTSLGGTGSTGIAACAGTTNGGGNPDDDVWYKFTTAATARTYTLLVDGSADYDAVVQVLSGACGTLAAVSCTNSTLSGGVETVTLSGLAANTTYYVRVYEFAAGYSSGDFTICLTDNFPRITSFTPITGPVGTSVALTGTGFTGATSVRFNGTAQATITGISATDLTVAVPAGATTGTLTVTTPVGTSAASTQVFTVVLPPTLTAVAPGPGGLGQSITLTGTNLSNPTALTINGANALGNIISNSGTSLVVRVPATATASGTISITTVAGTATSGTFTVMPAPGNALAFDGAGDYVALPGGLNTANFTFEAWVNYQDNGTWTRIFDFGTGQNTWMILGPKSGYAAPNTGNLHFSITTTGGGGAESTILSTTPMPVGRWQHVAVTLATTGSVTSGTLYLNGQVIGTNANLPISPASLGTLTNNWLGRSQYADPYLKGSLDEVRIWNTARTQAQVQADMLAPATSPFPAGLQFYLNADQGTPATASTGANTAYTTLYDLVSGQPAALNNFALTSGNTTSNYVESYAMVVPTATAATALSVTGFTANWTAPAVGTVDNGYRLDVATDAAFTALITGSPFTVASGTSRAITGLTAGTTYYYRVRADKTSVTGQGAPSNTMSVLTPCPAPVATAQSVNAPLDVTSTATVTAAQINNGSTANCGPAAVGALSLQKFVTGVISGEVAEGGTLTLTAPNGGIFTAINFASYGTPTGAAGSYATSGCNATNSVAIVGTALLGNTSGSIGANNTTFGDPCSGTVKKLAVTATYEYYSAAAPAATSATYTCANVGVHYVMLTVTSSTGATSQAQAKVTVSVPATPITTWSGAASADWTDCANWSYGQVPTAAISAIIPTGMPRYPSLPTGTFPVLSLTINTGGSLTVASGATLQVNGNFANNGAATMSGQVQFVGSAATQTLGGSTSTPFTALVVNKASGTVQLGQVLTINSGLTMTSGTLTTASYQVNLGGSASLSESETSYVIGKVAVNRTLAAGTAESFSGLGLTLTPATGSTAPGATLVTRTTGTAITGAGTSQSILRSFNIQPATNTGLNVTLNFGYFTHELNGIAVSNLAMFKSVSGGTPWMLQRGTTASTNVVNRAGITDFSVWTLGSRLAPLPVELTEFTATAEGTKAVKLAWATASEKNSDRFEVERSTSGTTFERIGTLAAAGSSSVPLSYALLDAQLPATATTLYYRLRQVDLDGSLSYSPVRTVAFRNQPVEGLTLVPNPARATTLAGAQAGAPVEVYDALGRRVLTASADAAGTAQLVLPTGLASGVYVVRTGTKAVRLVVE